MMSSLAFAVFSVNSIIIVYT